MYRNQLSHRRVLLAVLLATSALMSGCNEAEVRAVMNGISVFAERYENQEDEISFSDWLASELED